MSSSLTVVAVLTATPDGAATLRAGLDRLVAATLTEAGCLQFELNQSLDDSTILVLVESWATEADWQAHVAGAAMAEFQADAAVTAIADYKMWRLAPVG